jgi:hypothetical protein
MSLLPASTNANPTTTFFIPSGTNTSLPCGLTGTLSWSAGTSGTFSATITGVSSQLKATSQVTATVQSSNLVDGLAAWLVNAIPDSAVGGAITFIVAANPTNPAVFRISWVVDKF